MTDRTTKCLLALVVLGLWACALRPWLDPSPATAQAIGGGMPPPVVSTPAFPPQLGVSASGIAYVVSGGYINAYVVDGHPQQLRKIGQQPLPALPFSQQEGLPPGGGFNHQPLNTGGY